MKSTAALPFSLGRPSLPWRAGHVGQAVLVGTIDTAPFGSRVATAGADLDEVKRAIRMALVSC
jgi:hypothetical protein